MLNNDEVKYFLINYSPIIFINGFYYKGNIDNIENFFEAICNSFEQPPKPCMVLEEFIQAEDLNVSRLLSFIYRLLLALAVIFLIALVVFYVCYKRTIRRTFNYRLNDKINHALAKFHSSADESESSSYKKEKSKEAKVVKEDSKQKKMK